MGIRLTTGLPRTIKEKVGVGNSTNIGNLLSPGTGKTGVEPATSGVTDQHSNRLSYFPSPNNSSPTRLSLLVSERLFISERAHVQPSNADRSLKSSKWKEVGYFSVK